MNQLAEQLQKPDASRRRCSFRPSLADILATEARSKLPRRPDYSD